MNTKNKNTNTSKRNRHKNADIEVESLSGCRDFYPDAMRLQTFLFNKNKDKNKGYLVKLSDLEFI